MLSFRTPLVLLFGLVASVPHSGPFSDVPSLLDYADRDALLVNLAGDYGDSPRSSPPGGRSSLSSFFSYTTSLAAFLVSQPSISTFTVNLTPAELSVVTDAFGITPLAECADGDPTNGCQVCPRCPCIPPVFSIVDACGNILLNLGVSPMGAGGRAKRSFHPASPKVAGRKKNPKIGITATTVTLTPAQISAVQDATGVPIFDQCGSADAGAGACAVLGRFVVFAQNECGVTTVTGFFGQGSMNLGMAKRFLGGLDENEAIHPLERRVARLVPV
ncbi:hypothetical protein JCM10213_005435 [Rhodosporidiobolus nylandii]